MKSILPFFFLGLVLLSCKKDKNEDKVSYDLPWSTQYITWKNVSIGSHGSGYEIYYKDSLIRAYGESFGGPGINKGFVINDQVLYLFKIHNVYHTLDVLYTKDGGCTWKGENCGPDKSPLLHVINPDHVYCVTQWGTKVFFTGMGQSDLKMYEDTLKSGTRYLSDLTTGTDLDSTVIEINDTVQYVILFH